MITLSDNAQMAEKEMQAVIFYLVTFGYVDGDFDQSEKQFVLDYIARLVSNRVDAAMPDGEQALKAELKAKYTSHFHEEFERTDQFIQDMFNETVSNDEDQYTFVVTRLKLRCFEIFKSFDERGQESLMDTVDELLMADGVAHPAEVKFRAELSALLEEDLGVEMLEEGDTTVPLKVGGMVEMNPRMSNHPIFDKFEYHYSADREELLAQLEGDRNLIRQTEALFDAQRQTGNGRLAGVKKVQELAGQEQFLDGHVYVVPMNDKKVFDVTVLGDLHGCYSCLKAAVMQSHFFDKVNAYKNDPANNPDPKLVLLGDYIDRGLFSLNGVLRAVMELVNRAPEHVYMLRGNHEMYFEHNGEVYGGVKPAEAINTLKPYVHSENLRHYIDFFENMPNMLFLGETLFVHGGVPRDVTMKERYRDMASLNDKDLRFEMMWSDPSMADIVPSALQKSTARFSFGRQQAAAFVQRVGCHTIIRGHEKVLDGFDHTYNDDHLQMFTLFSCGGIDNDDLPPTSGFRKITPMAMSMTVAGRDISVHPWKIDYKPYNNADRNAFFKEAPQIELVVG